MRQLPAIPSNSFFVCYISQAQIANELTCLQVRGERVHKTWASGHGCAGA